MSFLPIIGSLFDTVGSFENYAQDSNAYNAATGAAQQDAAAQSQLFGSVENTLGGAWGNASNFWLNESRQGLDPAVIGAANNSYNIGAQQQMANVRNQFGGMLPNLSGTLEDMQENTLQGSEQLQGNLAAQNQGVKNQAMSSYFGGALGMTQPLLNIAGQYGQAGQSAQQNAMGAMQGMQQNNPFSAVGNLFTSFGGMMPSASTGGMGSYSPFGTAMPGTSGGPGYGGVPGYGL